MRKKLIYLFILGALVIGLTGCGGKDSKATSNGTNTS